MTARDFKRWCMRLLFVGAFSFVGLSLPTAAQPVGATSLTYTAGSSTKLEQVIGDKDWANAAKGITTPTTSQTVTRFNILGNGQGGSFESNGKLIFFFGDTISKDVAAVNYHAADPIAWSTSTDPESGLLLNFYTNTDGTPLFVKPPGIPMGPDAIPNAGINVNGRIYFVCNYGSDTSLPDPQSIDTSVLVQFDENAQTFAAVRPISPVGGHFIGTSLHALGPNVLLFGAGPYRKSDIYLQMTPASSFASGAGTLYFKGLVNGQPTWTDSEANAAPVVQDNPLNGPAWPSDSPTIGNLSVVYSSDLGLWFMTFDGGRQSNKTRGVYFTYAVQPWGPWSTPQLIYNDVRDNGYGVFIHDPNIVPDPPGDGLNGPVIGSNDPYTTSGGTFAPLMIERFTRVAGSTLKIYYALSTWNPYTVVKMRSSFTVAAPDGPPLISTQPLSQTIAPGNSAILSVTAAGATSYQWQKNGVNIAGATFSSLILNNLTAADSANYTVVTTNVRGSTTSSIASLVVATPVPGRLDNLSVRTTAGSNDQTLIAGFALSGGGSESLLVRATGPALVPFGVSGTLPDPVLAIHATVNGKDSVVATNDNWGGSSALSSLFQQTGAFPLTDPLSKDAALVLPANGGNAYTAQVSDKTGGTGIALIEIYDPGVASTAPRLINISARTQVGTGAGILIAGFTISGNTPKRMLIRAVGPALQLFGVSGVLLDPKLEIHTKINGQDTIVATNDNWSDPPNDPTQFAANFANVGAFPLPAGSKDSALFLTLAAGSYTALITGAGNSTGVALVEVYEAP